MNGADGFATAQWLCAALSPFSRAERIPESLPAWGAVLAAADRGLVLPRLALAMRTHAGPLPPAVQEHLAAALELNRLRNGQLRRQLVELLDAFNAAGLRPVVMKGASGLLLPEAEPGARVMLDIDIWTPETDQQQQAVACLHALGYAMRGTLAEYDGSQHFPPFFRDGALSRIELHRRMVDPAFAELVDETAAARSLAEGSWEGRRFRVLASADALRLAYVQCLWSGLHHVTLMKWCDLLDRAKAEGITRVEGPASFGLRHRGDAGDARLLTALGTLCGLPYGGPLDTGLIAAWQKAHEESTARRFLRNLIGNAHDPRLWRGRTAGEVWRALVHRIASLPDSLKRARGRERL